MPSNLVDLILNSPHAIPMTIGVYAGLEIINASVIDAVTSAQVQTEAILALHEYLGTEILMTAMDLSVEAELFGCQIKLTEDEIPTVIGRKITSAKAIEGMPIPAPNSGRARVQLKTVENLVRASDKPVLGCMIGPFSLAGRLFGFTEVMELSITEPDALERLLDKVSRFLAEYALAFRNSGAAGVIMAEPAAGLLSPRGLAQFSAKYIRAISEQTANHGFTILYHNCGARLVHLEKILEAGLEIYHFSSPMDILNALSMVEDRIILSGNLDPAAVFLAGSPEFVRKKTRELMSQAVGHRNFVIASGCDIPPHTPLANLEAFYQAVRSFPQRGFSKGQ